MNNHRQMVDMLDIMAMIILKRKRPWILASPQTYSLELQLQGIS
jgi:hypothetical protein